MAAINRGSVSHRRLLSREEMSPISERRFLQLRWNIGKRLLSHSSRQERYMKIMFGKSTDTIHPADQTHLLTNTNISNPFLKILQGMAVCSCGEVPNRCHSITQLVEYEWTFVYCGGSDLKSRRRLLRGAHAQEQESETFLSFPL